MIGNDIVDLELAKTESNWKRKGFLEKIFTESEQKIILYSENPEKMVWLLWSCKEAAYKIHNRQTLIRAFIPLQLECDLEFANKQISVKVKCFDKCYFCRTEVTENYIYTIAVAKQDSFQFIKEFDKGLKIIKKDGIPYIHGNQNTISITHHGKFDRRIFLETN
ncbi:phosphopantetheinyl transferase (holo-ACP synthase) [Flavobacterium arsenatis]|uniref:Phosphopantetheinyl transferase (Holo-ACP synthase) n=1 Tax=Flavobacterium arsenatis TaxID=1484332 RepID=A0ABU1TN24_9FLAO|nr:4'-phosphopantetheinyl transferase superfamily protein [Flavobacterium arsenatis]MDR6967367.1 phosphopantetheinyl transferase (holo-ACP synthase) [Flavobacterium arsenatis]